MKTATATAKTTAIDIMPSGLILRFQRGVAKDVRRRISRVCDRLREKLRFPSRVILFVAAAPVVCCRATGRMGLGFFVVPPGRRPFQTMIYLAGRPILSVKGAPCPRRQAIDSMIHVLCHEIAHYEQFRDGRSLQERGVNVRARTLAYICK